MEIKRVNKNISPQYQEYKKLVKKSKSSALEDSLFNQMKILGLPEPVKELKFHPTRKFRFDFAFEKEKIAIECEGGTWSNGAHNRGKHFEGDCEKYNEATRLGWKVFRFTGDMIKRGEAVIYIQNILKETI